MLTSSQRPSSRLSNPVLCAALLAACSGGGELRPEPPAPALATAPPAPTAPALIVEPTPAEPRPAPPGEVMTPTVPPSALCVDMRQEEILDTGISFWRDLRRPAPDAKARASIAQAMSVDQSAVIAVLRWQGDEHIAVVGRCHNGSCTASLIRAAPAGISWRIEANTPLWFTENGYLPGGPALSADSFGLTDLNGDGRDELWLEYVSTGRPDPVEAIHYGQLAAFAVPSLTPLMRAHITTSPMVDDAPAVDAKLSFVDLDCDEHDDLVVTHEYGISRCLGEDSQDSSCAAHPLRHERVGYRWNPEKGRYAPTTPVTFQRPPFEGA